jgi:ADP-ribose pyrophosphatase YjhB (NUDIX family)
VSLHRRTRVAAYAVCVRDEEILVVRLSRSTGAGGAWGLPGGGVIWGEAPRDAVVRELREETGLDGEVIELLDVGSRLDHIHTILIYYRVRVIGGVLRHEVGGSSDRAEWVPLARIRDLPIVDTIEDGLRFVAR